MKTKSTALTISPKETTATVPLRLLEQVLEDGRTEKNPNPFWKRFISFFNKQNNLTFDEWQRLERKPQRQPDDYRQPFSGRGL